MTARQRKLERQRQMQRQRKLERQQRPHVWRFWRLMPTTPTTIEDVRAHLEESVGGWLD